MSSRNISDTTEQVIPVTHREMDRHLRHLLHHLVVIVTEEVNHVIATEPQVLNSLINYYLLIVLVMLLLDLYVKLVVVNSWIISTLIMVWFAYYLNFKYFSTLLAIILNDLIDRVMPFINLKPSYQWIYCSTLSVILVLNFIILYSIKQTFEQIIQLKHWNAIDVYLLTFWFIKFK